MTIRETSTAKVNQAAIDSEPCGCPACDEQRQPGHFACDVPSEAMLRLEQEGRVARDFDGTSWIWEVL